MMMVLFRGFPDLQRFENPETGGKNNRQKHVITYPRCVVGGCGRLMGVI
jgi:hypothetical protein